MNSKTLARLLADRDRLARENERLREAAQAIHDLLWDKDYIWVEVTEEMRDAMEAATKRLYDVLAPGEREGQCVCAEPSTRNCPVHGEVRF